MRIKEEKYDTTDVRITDMQNNYSKLVKNNDPQSRLSWLLKQNDDKFLLMKG